MILIDLEHPTVKRLQSRGYEISFSVWLKPQGPYLTTSAYHRAKGIKRDGRSRRGDPDEALEDLAIAAGLKKRKPVSATAKAVNDGVSSEGERA